MGQASTHRGIYKDGKNINPISYEKMLAVSRSAMLTLDSDIRFASVTASISVIIGYKADNLIGKSYLDLIVPSYQEAFLNLIKNNIIVTLDYPLVHQNGDWCWVRHSGERIQENDSFIYNCMLQDVSHYKRPRDDIESERNLLQTIIDNLPAAIHATDDDGKFIFSNPAHARLLSKVRPSDVLGFRSHDFLPESVSQRLEAQDEEVQKHGKTIVNEEKFKVDDTDIWVNATKMPMRDAKGDINGVIGIARDITQQKISQQKLADSEARHRVLLDALPDLMFVVRRDGIITEFRSTPEVQALGVDESVIGTKFTDAGFPQALVDEAQLYLDLALQTQYIQSFEFSSKNQTKQKRTFDESDIDYFEARLVTLNEDEVMALVRNITQLKQVQDELNRHIDDLTIVRQVNMELAANLDLTYVAQIALDAAWRLSRAQAGYLVIVEDEELTLLNVFGEYNLSELNDYLANKRGMLGRVLKNKRPELIRDVHSDPDYIPLLADTKAMILVPLISNEAIVGMFVLEARESERFSEEHFQFLQLITGRIAAFLDNARLHRQTQEQLIKLKELYEEVRHLEQLKTDMIRIASHDLKNPLGSIMGYMEMLRMDMSDRLTEREIAYLDTVERAASKMQRITTGILSLERIEKLSEQQSRETVNLSELVRQSVAEEMDFAVRSEQTLKRHLPENDIFIQADPLQIHEATTNLINNAIKYTPSKGIVDVYLTSDNGVAKLRVKDTGFGIPEEQQQRLFSPFYRANTSETRNIEGTGLGLHLVQNIIERHEGTMYVESEYGVGSTFGYDIPILRDSAMDETIPTRPS